MVCLALFQCKNNPVSEGRGDITGIWKLTMYNGEAVGVDAENGEIYVIDESSITVHEFVDGCYDVSAAAPYSLSGDTILGEDFTHSETGTGYVYSLSTTYSFYGDKLMIKIVSKENDVTFTETSVFQHYSGIVPPAGWTDGECYEASNKKIE